MATLRENIYPIMINIANPAQQYQRLKDEIDKAVINVLESGNYTAGKSVQQFEKEFAAINESTYSIGVSSGTSALVATLRALHIGPGDDVVIPANTFIATAEAVLQVGANVVFADCEENYYGMEFSSLSSVITERTRAVIVVHMFGLCADLQQIVPYLEKLDIPLIEDCAQAHLATINSKFVGNFGIAGCFSFYPGKNLGACGEAGAVVCNDRSIEIEIRKYIDHGSLQKYHHEILGDNCRMDEIQSAILSIKLKHLKEANDRRQYIASQFNQHLVKFEALQLPKVRPHCQHVYHLYVIRYQYRDKLIKWLQKYNINAGIHYPIPCHKQTVFQTHSTSKPPFLPCSERYANTMLSLPVHAELSDSNVQIIIDAITAFFDHDNE